MTTKEEEIYMKIHKMIIRSSLMHIQSYRKNTPEKVFHAEKSLRRLYGVQQTVNVRQTKLVMI